MKATSCPCEYPLFDGETITYSPEWYRRHRDHHLAVFPDVDAATRRNLDLLIAFAERK